MKILSRLDERVPEKISELGVRSRKEIHGDLLLTEQEVDFHGKEEQYMMCRQLYRENAINLPRELSV